MHIALMSGMLCVTIITMYGQGRSYKEHPAWNSTLNFDSIEHDLKTQPIVKLQSMSDYLKKQGKERHFVHKVYVATLKNGLKAVFKPEKKLFHAYAETAAYRASKWLGQRLVPPTVLREHKGRRGSLQFFVESPFDLLKSDERKKAFDLLSDKAKSDMYLFYFVFWGKSTHHGNQIIAQDKDGKGYLALIDNASIMAQHLKELPKRMVEEDLLTQIALEEPTYRKEIVYPKVYSRATLNRYKELSIDDLRSFFKDALKEHPSYCSSSFLETILKRRDILLKLRKKKFIP